MTTPENSQAAAPAPTAAPPSGSVPLGGGPAPTPDAQQEQRLRGVSRSLLIAVGGTGHKMLLDVRQRLLQKYGSLDKLPIVSFLLLATDPAIFRKNPNEPSPA